MKFTPSNSVSSSSNSSSFSDNFYKSKGNAFGCFTGVLSRILCSKNLPIQPSDPIESYNSQHFSKIEKLVVDGSATPNVVAKLMGLDSMPEINLYSSHSMSNSIAKSMSMDSGEFRAETEDIQGQQHRRVKTSVSFRETQDFFELEDDDFFVLSFDNGGINNKKGSNFVNSEVGIKGKRRKRRRDKCGRKQRRNREEQSKDRVFSNEERLSLKISPQISPKFDAFVDVQKQSYHLSPLKEKGSCKKEEIDGNKARIKKKKEICLGEIKDEGEFESDNSSPISVLDHNSEFISDPEVTTSEEDARSDITIQSDESCKGEERETSGNEVKNVGLKRRDYKKHENIEMLRKTCKLAEAEVKNSNWVYKRMLRADDLEEIAKDFGQRIFDQLISECIDQLLLV